MQKIWSPNMLMVPLIPNTCQYCHFDRVSLMSKMDKPSYPPQGAHVRN